MKKGTSITLFSLFFYSLAYCSELKKREEYLARAREADNYLDEIIYEMREIIANQKTIWQKHFPSVSYFGSYITSLFLREEKKNIFLEALELLLMTKTEFIKKLIKKKFNEKYITITEEEYNCICEIIDALKKWVSDKKELKKNILEIIDVLKNITANHHSLYQKELDSIRKELLTQVKYLKKNENNSDSEWNEHFFKLFKDLVTPFILIFEKYPETDQIEKNKKIINEIIEVNIIGTEQSPIISQFIRYWKKILPEITEKDETEILAILWNKETIIKIDNLFSSKEDNSSLFAEKIEKLSTLEIKNINKILELTDNIITKNKEKNSVFFRTIQK